MTASHQSLTYANPCTSIYLFTKRLKNNEIANILLFVEFYTLKYIHHHKYILVTKCLLTSCLRGYILITEFQKLIKKH